MSTDNNDNSVKVNEKEELYFNKTGGNLPAGKIVTAIKKVFPSLTAMNTYRDRFKRIKRKTNYAQDLKLTSPSVNKVCNIDGECDLLSTIFLSHTKVNTGFIPYAGRKSKKVRKTSIRNGPKQLKDRLNIEHKFHNNSTYHEPFNNLNIELKVDGASKRVDSKDCCEYLYDYLMRPPSSNNENECVLIAGDVGCGKSTYIANVAHKIIHYNQSVMHERPVGYSRKEPIFFDAEELLLENLVGDRDSIYKHICKIIVDKIKDQCEVAGESIKDIATRNPGTTLILIFDNLDSIYNKFCKLIFGKAFFDERINLSQYFPFLYKFIFDFTMGKYSELGLRCVFVARSDTANLINYGMREKDNGERLVDRFNVLINVDNRKDASIKKIVEKRFILAKDMPKISKDTLSMNLENLTSSDVNYGQINTLSIHGLRHTISLFGALSWSIFNSDAFNRFFLNNESTLLYLYLGGKSNYTQISEGIANIFLVNNQYRIANNHTLPNGEKLYSPDLLEDHMHTYWLKYFVLQYIYEGNATENEIKNVFSQRKGKIYAYESSIVSLVLLSLSEFEHGRLVRLNIQQGDRGSVTTGGLECTDKAKYMIENNVFFSLLYLVVVIEDEWLEFPNFLMKRFSNYDDFCFLFDTDNERYLDSFNKMIINKAPLIMIFLDILEISYKHEKSKCKDVYNDSFFGMNIAEPDFDSIRDGIREELSVYQNKFSKKEKNELSENMVKYKEDEETIRDDLNKFFKKVYYSGFFNREIKRKIIIS